MTHVFRLNSRRSAQRRRRALSTRASSRLGCEPLEARRVLDSTVVFNEVMYNPVQDDASWEWIELHNQMSVDMDMSGWSLADGVDYTFPPNTILPGGGYLVVAAAPTVLENATGLTDVFGPFQRRISNAGDRIELRNHTGRRMDVLDFQDGEDWPVAADGSGATLAKMRPQAATEPAANWSFSTQIGGTPGVANGDFPSQPAEGLIFSEVTAGGTAGFWVELQNHSDQPISLNGLILASSELTGRDYRLPNQMLAPGAHHVVTATELGFQPQDSDRLWLLSADRSQLLDGVRVSDRLQGRSVQQQQRWQFPSAATPGADNAFLFHDQIVINEIMYQARPQYEQAPDIPFAESEEEWIELYNRSQQTVDLSGWSLNDAVRFDFPQGTLLGPDQYLVVAHHANDLAALHPGIVIAGEFAGRLSDSHERIQLLDAQQNLADEVHYYDGGRWPDYADAGGSSLELRDPHADNSRGEAWASSDETARSQWQHITYSGTVEPYLYDPTIHFNEFVMGLISPGEVWLDNLSVIESPGETNQQLIQNGSFDQDTPGTHADKWRLLGTHQSSEVIADPDHPGNQVLRLVAEARMNYLSNHAETTFVDNTALVNGRTYEISFDAKWINGTPQLRTELYYRDVARTTVLAQPVKSGTPGARNSTWEANLGPGYDGLRHAPLIPSTTDSVTVSVTVDDPDGVADVQLFYAVDDVAPFTSVSMTMGSDGRYQASIPPAAEDRVVQFYVQATDNQGGVSMFPAAGPDSRALYKVDDEPNFSPLRHDFRLIMTPADTATLFPWTLMMDNHRRGATVIYDNEEVYYDVGGRLKGSMHSRRSDLLSGYNVKFNPDQLFRGVHDGLTFDQNGEGEILVNYFSAMVGNPAGRYDDIMELTTPSGRAGGPTLVFLAAQDELFLNEQFENGDAGTVYKLEGIRVMEATVDPEDPESDKLYMPIGWVNIDIEDMGDDKELYRWAYLIQNNRDQDNFDPIIRIAKAFSLEGEELQAALNEVIDVEEWMLTFATMSLFGISDVYSYGGSHNLNFYERPSDGKVLAFPWDWDSIFGQPPTAPLHGNMNIGKAIDLPQFEHIYLGQMQHLIATMFQRSKLEHWTAHYGELLNSQFGSMLNSLEQRRNFVLSQLPEEVLFQLGENVLEMIAEPLVDSSYESQFLVPTPENGGDQLGDQWRQVGFTPSDDWQTGLSGIGFENTSSDFVGLINHDVLPMRTVNASAFIRIPFEVTDAASIDRLKLQMYYDDGFVAYLNGEQIVAANQPDSLQWNSTATASRRNTDVVNQVTFDLTEFLPLLQDGENVLAIQGLNFSATSSDFLIVPQLVAESFPEVVTKEGTASGLSIDLEGYGWVNVRQIRVLGRPDPLNVEWISPTQWKATVPLEGGENLLELQAIDYEGKVVGIDRIRVTATSPDFDDNGILNAHDIDLLCAAILGTPPADARFDLNGDGQVTRDDHEFMIQEVFKTSAGDANLDGLFTSEDLIEVLQYIEYEDGIDGNSTWGEGDWNCDGDFTTEDMIDALQTGRYEVQPAYRRSEVAAAVMDRRQAKN